MTLEAYYVSLYGETIARIMLDPALDGLDRSIITMYENDRERVAGLVLERARRIRVLTK